MNSAQSNQIADDGFFLVWRKQKYWKHYKEPFMAHVFTYLIGEACTKDGNEVVEGIKLMQGQLITSFNHISEETGVSVASVRTVLNKLEKSGEIARETISCNSNRFTLITISKYKRYQKWHFPSDIREKPTPSTIKTTHSKKPTEEQLNERRKNFADTIRPFVERYGNKMCNEFFAYWTEPNKSSTKLRYEMQQTWDIRLRLATWSRKNYNK